VVDKVENGIREILLISIVVVDRSKLFGQLSNDFPLTAVGTTSLLRATGCTRTRGCRTRGEADSFTLVVVQNNRGCV